MHSLLEDYLSEVAAHLSALPVKQRNEELREMRTHLENAVLVSHERGQSENEAAQSIVAQFGTPQELGKSTVTAWRRGVMLDRRSFWGAAALTVALTFWPNLPGRVVHLTLTEPFLASQTHPWQVEFWIVLVLIPSYFLCGLVCNVVFPRRGVAGTALAGTSVMLLFLRSNFIALVHEFPSDPVFAFLLTLEWFCPTATIFGVWAGSRWRQARRKRGRLART